MNDKQQLQMLGEHQAEQSMCMAKQVESLRQQVLERNDWLVSLARAAAGMQPDCDLSGAPEYVTTALSRIAEKHAAQLEAANRKIAVMAELLLVASNELCKEAPLSVAVRELIGKNIRGVAPFPPEKTESDYEQTELFDGPDPYSIGHMDGWNDFRRAALAGELPDHGAGIGKNAEPLAWRNTGHPNGLKQFLTQAQYEAQTPGVQKWFEPIGANVPEGWQLVPVELRSLSQDAKESLVAMIDYCLQHGIAMGMDEGFKSFEPEQKHPFRIELESLCAMLAAAPKPEQPDTAWTDAPAPEPTPQDYRELQERHDRLLSEHKAAVDALRDLVELPYSTGGLLSRLEVRERARNILAVTRK